MAYPSAVVEIAFDDGPYVVSPTWTDVTAYVRELTIDRGVNDDWNLVADGSATVVLSNRDRRFDPFYTSGPYYGNLLPRRQIRIRATHGGTTYDVFRGFIAGWPPNWTDAGYDSTVTLSCFDALQLLGSSSLPADWSRAYILSLSPRHYYPCDEPVIPFQSGTLRDLGSNNLPMAYASYGSSGSELAPGLPSRSFNSTETRGAYTGLAAASSTTDFTVSAWMTPDILSALGVGISNCACNIGFDQNTGKYVVTIDDGGSGLTRTYTTTNTYDGGQPRMVTVTFNVTSKAFTLYLDGISVTVTSSTAAAIVVPGESVGLVSGQFQQVLVFTSILTAAQIQNIFSYSMANFPETSSARVSRIIAETPFSATLVTTPASPASSLLDITNDAPAVSTELGKVADSEYGQLFVSKAGQLTLFQQNTIRTQSRSIVSQQTYGSGGLGIGQDVTIQYDGDSMRNTANIGMSGGGVYIQDNSTSQSTYGEAEQMVTTQVSNLADAQDIANIVTGWGGQVYPKVSPSQVVVSPDASWASTLGLELWDRVTFAIAPPTGNTVTVRTLVTRITHTMVPGQWSTTLEGSARWAAVFILNTSTLGGTDLLG